MDITKYVIDQEKYCLDCGHVENPGEKVIMGKVGNKKKLFCYEDCYAEALIEEYPCEVVGNDPTGNVVMGQIGDKWYLFPSEYSYGMYLVKYFGFDVITLPEIGEEEFYIYSHKEGQHESK